MNYQIKLLKNKYYEFITDEELLFIKSIIYVYCYLFITSKYLGF